MAATLRARSQPSYCLRQCEDTPEQEVEHMKASMCSSSTCGGRHGRAGRTGHAARLKSTLCRHTYRRETPLRLQPNGSLSNIGSQHADKHTHRQTRVHVPRQPTSCATSVSPQLSKDKRERCGGGLTGMAQATDAQRARASLRPRREHCDTSVDCAYRDT